MKKTGKIYIMTYSENENIVKIGFTTGSVDERADELNRATGVVGIYEPYASLETSEDRADVELHAWIDLLNPEARIIDKSEKRGKTHKRELYRYNAKQAWKILEKWKELKGNKVGELKPYAEENKEKARNFRFSMVGIKPGEELSYALDESKKCVVKSDSRVTYEGESYSLSALAKKLIGKGEAYQGPKYFKYKGEVLTDLRKRVEEKK